MAARARASKSRAAEPSGHPLSPAFLAMLPMLVCYELGVRALGSERHNAAEVLLGLWLAPFGTWADGIRLGLICAFAAVALHLCRKRAVRVRETVARIWLEGTVAALTLGPALIGLTALFTRWTARLDVAWDSSRSPPDLGTAGFVFGGAVYEELVFRIGLYGLLAWTSVRAARLLGAGERSARWIGDGAGLLGSALGFSMFHFRRFTHWLWEGGADDSLALFVWLACAGLLLGLVYRLRGPGVAACAHGLFNVGLLVGVDPDVLA